MPGKKRFDAQISFPISPEAKSALMTMADARKTTVSQIARVAVDEYISRETKRYAQRPALVEPVTN